MNLSVDEQLNYIVKWFNEWSELQRTDFIPILADYLANKTYVNGIVDRIANLDCTSKPMTLFECRIKLFREWYPNWGPEQREHLMTKIKETDPEFVENLNREMQNGHPTTNGMNGTTNGIDHHSDVELAENEV